MGQEDVCGRYQILKVHKQDWEDMAESGREELMEVRMRAEILEEQLEKL
jgi:hypothetical protein